jgi:glyoxylase-like metal-dependent hydrolase (beta-lactamase superfamily II)
MIVERVEHPEWLSNAYLVAERSGGHGVFIDSNGLTETLEERAERDGITITHVLCTHGHTDHVVAIEELAGRHDDQIVSSECQSKSRVHRDQSLFQAGRQACKPLFRFCEESRHKSGGA